ncbi:hypothetical protein [Chitinivibrio alkaliphilus]|uniref:Tetratricopeptide repeat protein n=1 Tax=Chitinivibrio alkaliphilus ACht1 TaxID=1313304 RepID=U7DAX8_9BACT|nr:hypothetical protein [Chitinivibrio alkaliphilus]ERP31560.1 hypothetical protein CALK_1605a [Chitinivibrio alkaliphilus ACht1]
MVENVIALSEEGAELEESGEIPSITQDHLNQDEKTSDLTEEDIRLQPERGLDLQALNEEILSNAKPKSSAEKNSASYEELQDLEGIISQLKQAYRKRKNTPAYQDSSFSQRLAADEGSKNIPDHVLTPTFADIYLQQGQPHLAMEIYKRLAERQTDNEEYIQKIQEIEHLLQEKNTNDEQD